MEVSRVAEMLLSWYHVDSKMDEITIDGRAYIPVKAAAALAGYTADYVGQLCRGGKLEATRIGRAWYVDEDSIIAHKETQLLGEKKERSETPPVNKSTGRISPRTIFKESSFIVYHSDNSPLLPKLISQPEPNIAEEKSIQTKDIAQKQPSTNLPAPIYNTPSPLVVAFESVGSFVTRAFLTATSFAIVFLLIFSFNGLYTKTLITDSVKGAVATALETEAGQTVDRDLLEPLRYAATEFAHFIDENVYTFVYEDIIYDSPRRR